MIYNRRVIAGEFQVVCPWLCHALVRLGLWNDTMRNLIVSKGGSVQGISSIPEDVQSVFKTVWEISQKRVIDLAVDRAPYICQSQSLNIHLRTPTIGQLTSMHFYGWKRGLKTGMYYLRTSPAAQPIPITIERSEADVRAMSVGREGLATIMEGAEEAEDPYVDMPALEESLSCSSATYHECQSCSA